MRLFRHLLLFAFGLPWVALAQNPTGTLVPVAPPYLRATAFNVNPQMQTAAVAQAAPGTYWWAGVDSIQELYGQDVLGNVFIEKLEAGAGGDLAPTVAVLYRGKGQVLNLAHLGAGRGLALLLGYKSILSYNGHAVSPRDPQAMNYALAWIDDAGAVTRMKALIGGSSISYRAYGLCADSAGNAYVTLGNFQDSYIQKYSLGGDSLFSITNHHCAMTTQVSVSPAGDIVAIGGCMDAPASVGGLAVRDSIFSYTSFIAGYSPQGVGRWVHTVNHITCPHDRLLDLSAHGLGMAWVGTRVQNMHIGGQPLPVQTTFYDGLYAAFYDPATGLMDTLMSGPDAATGSLNVSTGGSLGNSLGGLSLVTSGRPGYGGQFVLDSSFGTFSRAMVALWPTTLRNGAGHGPAAFSVGSGYPTSMASCHSATGGVLVGSTTRTDTLRVHSGTGAVTAYPVADGPGATLYLQAYELQRPVATVPPVPPAHYLLTARPNPTTGQIYITPAETAVLELMTTAGRVVTTQPARAGHGLWLDMSAYPAGLYLVRNGAARVRVVKM